MVFSYPSPSSSQFENSRGNCRVGCAHALICANLRFTRAARVLVQGAWRVHESDPKRKLLGVVAASSHLQLVLRLAKESFKSIGNYK